MGEAIGIGAIAASSLVLGALLAVVFRLPGRAVGLMLGFGAGALISSVSLELAEEAVDLSGIGLFAAGLALGALTFYAGDRLLEEGSGRRRPHRVSPGGTGGGVLALGALLDGVPEQAVLGIGLAAGEPANVALLAAIFISNLPEGIGSAAELRRAGRPSGAILRLWLIVAAVCVAATAAGYGLLDGASEELRGVVEAFAAGAVLCMLVDSMIPEARRDGGRATGLACICGFAVAIALSRA
jgi:zinc transporter, ZIP family